ncbi:MAG: hypothetical protein II827_03960 [Paludibacteraceae bacterium]|nr:hypothetical protein [Paludibacteraceae bacterium]
MKKIYALICSLLFTLVLSAQTYNGGNWYSYYNNSGFDLETKINSTSGVSQDISGFFAPVAGTLSFKWKYVSVGYLGLFPSNNTEVNQSTDGGSHVSKIATLDDDTYDKEHSESLTINAQTNWIQWNRPVGNTHKLSVYNIAIPLAHHILYADGTSNAKSNDFGELKWGENSEAYRVNLRSFYTTGDITITSDIPSVFRIGSPDNTTGMTYAVGANACASANGTGVAGGSNLGKISNYDFDIYFCPQDAVEYNGTVTITDGTSTLVINVSGVGLKRDQTIDWDQTEGEFLSNVNLTEAVASSGLDIEYSFAPEGIIADQNGTLVIVQDHGEVTVTAAQAGSAKYNAAEPVSKTFVIHPAVTYGVAEDITCPNSEVTFLGQQYGVGSHDVYIPNVWGGDSVITLTVNAFPTYNITDGTTICPSELPYAWETETFAEAGSKTLTLMTVNGCDSVVTFTVNLFPTYEIPETHTMYVGKADTWHGKDLSVYGVGVHTIYDSLKTEVYGCDSVYVLTLTVNVLPTSSEDLEAIVCPGDSIEHDGKFYKVGEHELRYQNIYGGDSVINLIVSETQTYFFTDARTQYVGKAGDWRGKDLSVYGVGEHLVYDSLKTEVYGCDSVYRLTLTIEALPTSESAVSAKVCPGETIEFDGNRYGAGVHALHYTNVLGGDSTVTLTVSLYPTYEANPEILEIFEHANETWNGHDLSIYEVGVYSILDTLPTVNGCDSVVSLELWVNELPTTYGSDGATICPGEKFVYQDSTLTEARKYRFTLVNSFGGDSIVTFTLKHYQAYSVEENRTITFGDPAIVWHEQTIENLNAGNYTYIDTLPTINGCDSICTFHLTVNKAPQTIIWENTLPDTLMVGETAPLAAAESSVGLEISYHVSGETFAEWNGTEVLAIAAGTITVTASQPGNENYLPAEPISVSLVIDEVTALEDLIINDTQARKLMHNGVIYILRNNAIYDLNGQRIR